MSLSQMRNLWLKETLGWAIDSFHIVFKGFSRKVRLMYVFLAEKIHADLTILKFIWAIKDGLLEETWGLA